MARAALRPVSHEDRLSLVEHLDELRTRIIICVLAFLACFAVAFWQNDRLLDIMNRPLEKTAFKKNSQDPFEKSATYQLRQKAHLLKEVAAFRALAADKALSAESRRMLAELARDSAATAAATPKRSAKRPVTRGVGEPFTATFKVAAYA